MSKAQPKKPEMDTAIKAEKQPHKQAEQKPKRQKTSVRALRFTPYAWAKLLFLRDVGQTEVGGFGIANPNDLLLVEDIQLVEQTCDAAYVAFDDESVADFFDVQVDSGRQPREFGRIWIHTHPDSCPEPSGVDEETFANVFGRSDWAVMFIIARRGATYARLRMNTEPFVEMELPIEIDYTSEFAGTDRELWLVEYQANVQPMVYRSRSRGSLYDTINVQTTGQSVSAVSSSSPYKSIHEMTEEEYLAWAKSTVRQEQEDREDPAFWEDLADPYAITYEDEWLLSLEQEASEEAELERELVNIQ